MPHRAPASPPTPEPPPEPAIVRQRASTGSADPTAIPAVADAGGTSASRTGPTSAPALSPPRWSGRKTAVAAALAIGFTSVGTVAAAAALPQGTGADTGGPGGRGPGRFGPPTPGQEGGGPRGGLQQGPLPQGQIQPGQNQQGQPQPGQLQQAPGGASVQGT